MDLTLHGLFEDRAARDPGATAVVWEGGSLSYGALDARATELAVQLTQLGVRPADLVAVVLDRSADLVAALLATLKTGAAFVPIDTGYPAERIAHTCEDARPSAVVIDPAAVRRRPGWERLLPAGVPRATTGPPAEPVPRATTSPPPGPVVLPDQAAYVVYTSGSTGRPKGVVISHRSIVNYVTWQLDEYPLTPADRVLQQAPAGFDGAVLEFFLPLCAGATLVLARPDGQREPEYIAGLIARERVTVAQFVPSMLPFLLEDGLARQCGSLRRVYSASDALPATVQQRFQHRFGAELVNLYGPTEATIDAAHWRCRRDPAAAATVPLGEGVRGMRVEVLDAELRQAAPGEVGEIYLSGVQLARGYLGRAGLTSERFVACPFGTPGERMYRTGDLGRKRQDGVLEFAGRADDQVKIGGVRVEPGEIEAALAGHPDIRLAAAKAVTAPTGERRLAAYAVIAGGRELTPESVRAYLRERIPEGAVPTYVYFLDDLPLTANDKLDRAALPVPGLTARRGDAGQDGADGVERAFLGLVRDVLGVEHVTAADGFIGLGGDSISAIHLAGSARQAGFALSTSDVLRSGTIGELLEAARAGGGSRRTSDTEGIGSFPPTPIMRWLHELGGPVDSFAQSMVVNTPPDARQDEVLGCLQALLDGHDLLRARFGEAPAGAMWRPEVLPPGAVSAARCLETVDVSALGEAELRERVREGVEAARQRLDVGAPRLVQAVWFRREGRQGRLAVVVNHLVIDGVSLRVLRADLADAWRGLRGGGGARLAPVPVSFRRWARLLEREARDPARRRELRHWRSLSGAGLARLARRAPGPGDTLATARTLRLELPAEQTGTLLGRAPEALRAEVNTLLVTALALALAAWHDPARRRIDQDFLIAMEGHGRQPVSPGIDLDRTVGWFTTMFPVRLGLQGIERHARDRSPGSLREAVGRIGAQLAAIPDKGFGFGLLRHLNPETGGHLTDLERGPDVLFNYLGRFPETGAADWALHPEHDVALDLADSAMPLAFPIELNCVVAPRGTGNVLSAVWQWADALIDGRSVAGLAELWFACLTELAGLATRAGALTTPRGGHDETEAEFTAF